MNYAFHPDALQEYLDGASRYATINPCLAEAFVLDAERAIERIIEHPHAWPAIENDIRHCLLKRFPFAIYYIVEEGTVTIYAFMHTSREPEYWRGRIAP
ncbi:MAG TPA: plasmid stabilization protein [Planctomycetes bacterium]|jgi:plasmid stabilization system protein ParE|nr:plasmid stabilization protein [Planctomycetota bacterium]